MGSQDLVGSLTSFLPVSAWFWGCWLGPTFVVDEGQKGRASPGRSTVQVLFQLQLWGFGIGVGVRGF